MNTKSEEQQTKTSNEVQTKQGDTVEQIAEGVWAIDDKNEGSLYLIEGQNRAVLIDTGMAKRPVMPLIRCLTSKPVDLILTHAHIDHMYHADEFETVYLHEKDIAAWRWPLGPSMTFSARIMFHVKAKRYRVREYLPLKENDHIDLGGVILRVLSAPGHTPGSILLADDTHHLLFTGDAFGSGAGVWMWLPGCLSVTAYKNGLTALLPRLAPCQDYLFLGGHRRQGKPFSTDDFAQCLNLDVVKDMITLCEELTKKTLKPIARKNLGPLHISVYTYGKASIVVRE